MLSLCFLSEILFECALIQNYYSALDSSKFIMSEMVSQRQSVYYVINEVVLHLATVNLKLK